MYAVICDEFEIENPLAGSSRPKAEVGSGCEAPQSEYFLVFKQTYF
jgi:hypothetical protein